MRFNRGAPRSGPPQRVSSSRGFPPGWTLGFTSWGLPPPLARCLVQRSQGRGAFLYRSRSPHHMSKTDRIDRKPTTTRAKSDSVRPAKPAAKSSRATPGKPRPTQTPPVTPKSKRTQKAGTSSRPLAGWSVAEPTTPEADHPAEAAQDAQASQAEHPAPDLTLRQSLFVAEYLRSGNATRAYLSLDPSITVESAAAGGYRMLRNAQIAAEVEKHRQAASTAAVVDQAWLLGKLVQVVEADAREVSEWVVGCCRYCHGFENRWQRTQGEWDRDYADWLRWQGPTPKTVKRRRKRAGEAGTETPDSPPGGKYDPSEFDPMGGTGFDERKAPNPDCPECFGRGRGRSVMKDTRLLSKNAAFLFDGVEQTREGIKLKTLSRMDAMEKLAKHLGFYEKDKGADLAALLESIMGAGAKRSALMPVREDPPA